MSREPNKKTVSQQALIDLRKHAGLTQFQLAVALGVTPVTTARWESSHAPHGERLNQLSKFAEERGAPTLAKLFRDALDRELQLIEYDEALWETDESVDLQIAISRARELADTPGVGARWDRLFNDLIFILRHKTKLLRESPAYNPQLNVPTPPEEQKNFREKPETEQLEGLVRRLIEQRRAEKKAQKRMEASFAKSIRQARKRT